MHLHSLGGAGYLFLSWGWVRAFLNAFSRTPSAHGFSSFSLGGGVRGTAPEDVIPRGVSPDTFSPSLREGRSRRSTHLVTRVAGFSACGCPPSGIRMNAGGDSDLRLVRAYPDAGRPSLEPDPGDVEARHHGGSKADVVFPPERLDGGRC
jgi:hypothetical protein